MRSLSGLWRPSAASRMSSRLEASFPLVDWIVWIVYCHAIGCLRAVETVCSIKDELKVRCLIPIGRLNGILSCYWLFPGCGDRLQHQGWAQGEVPPFPLVAWIVYCHAIGCFWGVENVCSVKDELKVSCLIPIGRLKVYSTLMLLVVSGPLITSAA